MWLGLENLTPEQKRELWVARLMAHLPISWTTAIGAYMGERAAHKAIQDNLDWIVKMHRNLECLLQMEDRREREAWIINWTRRVGRMYSEYTLAKRLVRVGNLQVVGQENLKNLEKPVIFISCHLGNWELAFHVLTSLERSLTILYAPQNNQFHQAIATWVRQNWGNPVELIPASSQAMFQLIRSLQNGNNLLVYVDENKDDYVWAPSLGRSLPYAGNRWLMARLAVRYEVDIIPLYVEEIRPSRYQVVIETKLKSLELNDSVKGEKAKNLADQMDQIMNQWIISRFHQWYWMSELDIDKPFPSSLFTFND